MFAMLFLLTTLAAHSQTRDACCAAAPRQYLYLDAVPMAPLNTDLASAVQQRRPTEVEAGVGYESLTAGMSDWKDVFARVQGDIAPGAGLHVEVGLTERFELVDTQLRLGANARFGGWSGDAEVAFSPTAEFLPRLSLLAGAHRDLGSGFVIGISGRYHDYDLGAVRIATLSTDYYAGPFRVGYMLAIGFIDGESAGSHAASASRYYGSGSSVTFVASAGESVERISADAILSTDMRAMAIWGVHWADPRFGITYGASFHRQGDLYDRRRGRVGLKLRVGSVRPASERP